MSINDEQPLREPSDGAVEEARIFHHRTLEETNAFEHSLQQATVERLGFKIDRVHLLETRIDAFIDWAFPGRTNSEKIERHSFEAFFLGEYYKLLKQAEKEAIERTAEMKKDQVVQKLLVPGAAGIDVSKLRG